jgi:hypothetical protein
MSKAPQARRDRVARPLLISTNTMRHLLSSCLIATALLGSPVAAFAESAPVAAQVTSASPKPAAVADADRYAALEKQSSAAARFEGGAQAVYIGGSVVTLLLVVLILVIVL